MPYLFCKTLGHYTAFQFGLNTRELCFCRQRTEHLAIPTFAFSFLLLACGIFTIEGDSKITKLKIMISYLWSPCNVSVRWYTSAYIYSLCQWRTYTDARLEIVIDFAFSFLSLSIYCREQLMTIIIIIIIIIIIKIIKIIAKTHFCQTISDQ